MTDPKSTLYTIGYGRWPTARRLDALLGALEAAGVNLLVDVRHAPCASQLQPGRYGPKGWHLRPDGAGLPGHLARRGIDYVWLAELGNPQKRDPAQAVLREHLRGGGASEDVLAALGGYWPAERGLALLTRLIALPGRSCCLLCACADAATCHRRTVAEALGARTPVAITHLR